MYDKAFYFEFFLVLLWRRMGMSRHIVLYDSGCLLFLDQKISDMSGPGSLVLLAAVPLRGQKTWN